MVTLIQTIQPLEASLNPQPMYVLDYHWLKKKSGRAEQSSVYHSISALYGYSLCCITLTPRPPYSQSEGVEGASCSLGCSLSLGAKEREQPRFLRSWQQPLPPFSSAPLPLSSLYPHFLSLALYSALGADWPDHDGNQPGPSVKASPAIRPPPPGTPPLLGFANFLPSPCSSTIIPPDPTPPSP